jgi:predicted DNA-binding WGR domain protein
LALAFHDPASVVDQVLFLRPRSLMSFFRKVFRRGSGDGHQEAADDRAAGGTSVPGSPELGDRTYLEFVGGSAAKFYAAVMEQGAGAGWAVSFNFGRIGFPREWARKVDGVEEPDARRVYADLIAEKQRKGYERRSWPAYLALPSGERPDEQPEPASSATRGIYSSAAAGRLPTETGGSAANVDLPRGRLLRPMPEGGPRGNAPVLWVSDAPDRSVGDHWRQLARAFSDTGLWPLIVDPSRVGIDRLGEILMDVPRSTGADPFQLLRRWWHEASAIDDDEFQEEAFRPFGRSFPGLAARTQGDRPRSIELPGGGLAGHLGIVAVDRPARTLDAIGWMGPANYDMNPAELSAILDTWEDRFDAYLVGLGFDTITLAVGRPPRDLGSATAIAAEHLAFCPDNIFQGAETIGAYAASLVGTPRWDFWWD